MEGATSNIQQQLDDISEKIGDVEVSEQISEAVAQKADAVQNKTGVVVSANNCAYTPLKGLSLYGKTTQNGTPAPGAPIDLVSIGNGTISTTIVGSNLFNLDTISSGYTINDAGAAAVNANYMASDYIPVNGNTSYTSSEKQTYTLTSGSSTTTRCACYDENKNFISVLYTDARTEVKTYTRTFVVPANARFIRIGYRNTDENIMVNIGSDSLSYETYKS